FGGGSFTPARRALESPMAIACLVERAPCFPSRMCSIVSRTNSPAWVEGALPSRFALRARSIVFFSGMVHLLKLSALRRFTATDRRNGRVFLASQLRLQDALGFLQLPLPRGRQVLAGPVDEELDHADPGAYALGANFLARHGLGDGLSVLREQPLGRIRRDGLHIAHPFFLFNHHFLLTSHPVMCDFRSGFILGRLRGTKDSP